MKNFLFWILSFVVLFVPAATFASEPKILTNHLGYEPIGPKQAFILGQAGASFSDVR